MPNRYREEEKLEKEGLFDDRYKDVIPLDLVDGDIANADIKDIEIYT